MRVLRLTAQLAGLVVFAAFGAGPAMALGAQDATALAQPAADAVELGSGTGDPDAASVEAAGQEVSVPLPVETPVDVAVDLPVSGFALGVEDAADVDGDAGAASAARRPGGGWDRASPPPAAVAVTGAGLLAVLVGAAGMGLFSRIEGPAVLEHPTRARLMGLVAEQPGLTILQVQERLGTAWGTTVHHVRRLEANGLLASVRQGPRVLLYAANTPEAKARRDLALLRNGTAREVARLVAGTPGIRTGILSATLGIGAPSASKHLSRFAAAGLVEHPDAGGFVATERLHQALAMV